MERKEVSINRMVTCKKCKLCTLTELEQVGNKNNALVISTKCTICQEAGFLQITPFEWDSIKVNQIIIPYQ